MVDKQRALNAIRDMWADFIESDDTRYIFESALNILHEECAKYSEEVGNRDIFYMRLYEIKELFESLPD